MSSAKDLVIFHYHLLPGGVTSVIRLSVRAILESVPEIESIRIVVGRLPSGGQLSASVDVAGDRRAPIETVIVPELDYLDPVARAEAFHVSPGTDERNAVHPRSTELGRTLLERFGGAIWWVHNYNLGKNPFFTEALLWIAASRPEQRIVFHVHDFPECGRYENVELLRRNVRLPLYPIRANVRYVVINERDRRLLGKAGVPPSILFLLNDPVPSPQPERAPERDQREAAKLELAKALPNEEGRFDPLRPMLLYPVRTIRRKNVLEAALLAEVAGEGANLIVTLPGRSEQELPYSGLVSRCFREGLARGYWGIGERIGAAGRTFQDLVDLSDAVLSTSVQEGFGYFFIDSLRWRKPLIARRIDVLDGMGDLLECRSAFLYPSFVVPLDPGERGRHLASYAERVRTLERVLPAGLLDRLRLAVEELFAGDEVDFSFLSLDAQRRVLERLPDQGFRAAVASANAAIIARIRSALSSAVPETTDAIEKRYGLAGHAQAIRAIIRSFETMPALPSGDELVHERLLASFASPENLRLILA